MPLCYASNHDHAPNPGADHTRMVRAFYAELAAMLRAMGSAMILGTEHAAAEPFMSALTLNDLRPQVGCQLGIPIPLYQYVFHECADNFSGNECLAYQYIPCREYPENLLYRIAYGFAAGNLLALSMRAGGLVDWGAGSDWSAPPPNQEHVFTLVRRLNALRRQYPQFLRHGRMQQPTAEFQGDSYELSLRKKRRELDAFFCRRWEAPDGTSATFVINYLPREQTIHMHAAAGETRALRLPPLSAHVLHDDVPAPGR